MMKALLARMRTASWDSDYDGDWVADMHQAADELEERHWKSAMTEPMPSLGMGDRVREIDHNVQVLTFVKYSQYGKAVTHWRHIEHPED